MIVQGLSTVLVLGQTNSICTGKKAILIHGKTINNCTGTNTEKSLRKKQK